MVASVVAGVPTDVGALLEEGEEVLAVAEEHRVVEDLLAVSGACDRDQFVFFDNAGSWIARRDTVIGKKILAPMKEMDQSDKLALTRKNGTYSMPVWEVPPSSETGFQRQGK